MTDFKNGSDNFDAETEKFESFCRDYLDIELTPYQREIYKILLKHPTPKVEISDRLWKGPAAQRVIDDIMNPGCGYYESIPFWRRVRTFLRTGRWKSKRYVEGFLDMLPKGKPEFLRTTYDDHTVLTEKDWRDFWKDLYHHDSWCSDKEKEKT